MKFSKKILPVFLLSSVLVSSPVLSGVNAMMGDSTVTPQSEERYLSGVFDDMLREMRAHNADASELKLCEALRELLGDIKVNDYLRPYDFRELLASGILEILGLEDYKSFASKYTIKWGELEVHPIHWTRNIEGLLTQFYIAYENFFSKQYPFIHYEYDFDRYRFPDYNAAPGIVYKWKGCGAGRYAEPGKYRGYGWTHMFD